MTSTADLVTKSLPDLTKDEKKTFKEMTMGERVNFIRDVITVEPVMVCYLVAGLICVPSIVFLEFEKACKSDADFNETICDAILTNTYENFTAQNSRVQDLVADLHSWNYPVQSVIPCVLILFLGSYSDRHKIRKPFLLLPMFGELLAVLGCLLSVFFMHEWPLPVLGFLQTVVPSLFGGLPMFIMASFAYIADVSTLEMRTLRVGVAQIALNVCTPITQSFSGVLLGVIGYYGIFSTALVIYLIGILYGIFFVKEVREPVFSENKKSFIADAFDPKHAIETFQLLRKGNIGSNRLTIILLMVVLFISSGITVAENSVFYSFVQEFLNWGPVEYSFFITFNTLIHLAGTIIAVPLFTKYFKFSDYTIIIISFGDKVITNILYGLADTYTYLYVAASVSIIIGIAIIALRSLVTKIVPEKDLGKAQSLFGICETVGQAFLAYLYNNQIYKPTKDSYPKAFFFVGAFLFALCTAIILWMFFSERMKSVDSTDATKNGSDLKNKGNVQMSEIQTTHI